MPGVSIEVDIHERNAGLLDAIIERGMGATEIHMETSDVKISYNDFTVAIELKRGNDFLNSLYKNRLADQICRLYDFDFPVLIIESGRPFFSGEETDSSWKDKMEKYLKTIRTLNRRLAVYETTSQKNTVELIWEIYQDLIKGRLQTMKRVLVVEPEVSDSMRILCSLAHVNRVTANLLLEKFGSPEQAFRCLDEWPSMNIGMTTSRCEAIRKAYEGE